MKKSVTYLIITYCFLSINALYAIDGVSASKLIVPTVYPVGVGALELEPVFSIFRSRGAFNEWGHMKNLPGDYDKLASDQSRQSESENGLGFRMTAGVFENLEIGATFGQVVTEDNVGGLSASGYNDLSFAAKYLLTNPDKTKFNVALQAGVAMETAAWTMAYSGGIIFTWEISERLSIDMDAFASTSSSRVVEDQKVIQRGYGGNIGVGYKLFKKFTPIVELAYSAAYSRRFETISLSRALEIDTNTSELTSAQIYAALSLTSSSSDVTEHITVWEKSVTASAGFVYDINSSALVVISYSQNFAGVNSPAGQTIAGAFTITFAADKKGDGT